MTPWGKVIRQGVRFEWSDPQQKAFEQLKTLMNESLKLEFFSRHDHTIIFADAGPRRSVRCWHNETKKARSE